MKMNTSLSKYLLIIGMFVCLSMTSMSYAETTTTTTTTTPTTTVEKEVVVEKKNDSSLVGGFFHFLGEVIAFPFRVIGNVFDAIF